MKRRDFVRHGTVAGGAALFGLADIHFRKKKRKESLNYYEEFLKAAPPGMAEIPLAKERVRLLESGGSF